MYFIQKFIEAALSLLGLASVICSSNFIPRMMEGEIGNMANIMIVNGQPFEDLLRNSLNVPCRIRIFIDWRCLLI